MSGRGNYKRMKEKERERGDTVRNEVDAWKVRKWVQ